jgi:hypothetical protein
MISNLLNILKNDERLFGWNIKVTTTSSYQLFFIRQQLDMNREVVADDYDVTIKGTLQDIAKGNNDFSIAVEDIDDDIGPESVDGQLEARRQYLEAVQSQIDVENE